MRLLLYGAILFFEDKFVGNTLAKLEKMTELFNK